MAACSKAVTPRSTLRSRALLEGEEHAGAQLRVFGTVQVMLELDLFTSSLEPLCPLVSGGDDAAT